MPYRCKKSGNKWIRQKQLSDGSWVKDAEHDSEEKCKASIKAIGANKHSNKCKVDIRGYIGLDTGIDSLTYQMFEHSDAELVEVSINSMGGSYPEALQIYDKLNTRPGKVRIRIAPIAASAGAVIALLPKAEVVIPENGLLRHHMPKVINSDPKNTKELEQELEQLKPIEQTLINMITARTGMKEDEARSFLEEDRWLTANQALELGLVDKVLPLATSRQKVDISNCVLPEQIVAHVTNLNERIDTMDLKSLCTTLELEVVNEATDEQMSEQIVNHVGELLNTIQDLTKERDALKVANKPPQFPERIVNILVREREGEIDRLVTEGKITGAVAKGLKKQFADSEQIVNMVDEKGNPIDGFDGLISSLTQNEKVINFGDQPPKVPLTGGEGETNPLIADAERRRKERGQ